MSESRPLTTGQAARYCHVSQATIINWIKEGKLKAYATPGGHHRILLSDFVSFLGTYGMPVDSTLKASSRPRVLIVSDGPGTKVLTQALQGNGRFDVVLANNDYEASAQIVRSEPNIVVLNTTSATLDCLALCRWLRTSTSSREKQIAVLAVGSPEGEDAARTAGADAYIPTNAIADKLTLELETLL